jgi:hypothetical protein
MIDSLYGSVSDRSSEGKVSISDRPLTSALTGKPNAIGGSNRKLLSRSSRYAEALLTDGQTAARAVAAGGYATHPGYAD